MMGIACLFFFFYVFRYKIIKEMVQVNVSSIQVKMSGTLSRGVAVYSNAQQFRTGGKEK